MLLNINNAIQLYIITHIYTLLCVYVCTHMFSIFMNFKTKFFIKIRIKLFLLFKIMINTNDKSNLIK